VLSQLDQCACWQSTLSTFDRTFDIAFAVICLREPAPGIRSLSEQALRWYELANRFVDPFAWLVAEETPVTLALWHWCREYHATWAKSAFASSRVALEQEAGQYWRRITAREQLIPRARPKKLMVTLDRSSPFASLLPADVQIDYAARALSVALDPAGVCAELRSCNARPTRRLLRHLTILNEREAAVWTTPRWVAVDALDEERVPFPPREYGSPEMLALVALGVWGVLPTQAGLQFVQMPTPIAALACALSDVVDAGPVLASDPLDLLGYAVELVDGGLEPREAIRTIRLLAA
jgi:hypothetical protein